MIVYLVSATLSAGVEEAQRRGWHRLAAFRFATPDRHEVRLVTRISDLIPFPGVNLLIKGPDYDEGPPEGDAVGRRAWLGTDGENGQRAEFDAFVDSGRARWVADESEIPINRGTVYGEGGGSGTPQRF